MILGSCDYTYFTPKHVANDVLKYQVSKMNIKQIRDSRVSRYFPHSEVIDLAHEDTRLPFPIKELVVTK